MDRGSERKIYIYIYIERERETEREREREIERKCQFRLVFRCKTPFFLPIEGALAGMGPQISPYEKGVSNTPLFWHVLRRHFDPTGLRERHRLLPLLARPASLIEYMDRWTSVASRMRAI